MADAASGRLPDPLAAFFFSTRDVKLQKPYIEGGRPAPPPTWSFDVMTIDEITENFSILDDWDDRYRYVIELGRTLAPLPDPARVESNKVQGCASQVWLTTEGKPDGTAGPVLTFVGDSDAHIVRGLIAILFAVYSGKPAREILATDAVAVFERLRPREHLPPPRSDGFPSMVDPLPAAARGALAEVA